MIFVSFVTNAFLRELHVLKGFEKITSNLHHDSVVKVINSLSIVIFAFLRALRDLKGF